MCVWQWICVIFSHLNRLPAPFSKTHLSLGVCAPLSRLFKCSSVRGGDGGNIRCQLLPFSVVLHIIIHRLFNLPSLNENPPQPLTHLLLREGESLWGLSELFNLFQLNRTKKRVVYTEQVEWTLKSTGEEGSGMIERYNYCYGVFPQGGNLRWYTESLFFILMQHHNVVEARRIIQKVLHRESFIVLTFLVYLS